MTEVQAPFVMSMCPEHGICFFCLLVRQHRYLLQGVKQALLGACTYSEYQECCCDIAKVTVYYMRWTDRLT